MSELGLDALRKANVARCEQQAHPINDWTGSDYATAAASALGYCCAAITKARQGLPVTNAEIAMQIADAVCYLDLLAARCGIPLSDAIRERFNTLSASIQCDIQV